MKKRISKRVFFLVCLVCLVVSIFVIGYLIDLGNHFIKVHHYKMVEQELSKIPNIEISNINITDDDVVSTLIKVKHKGFLQFIGLRKESFSNSPHLLINRFESFQIISKCYPNGIERNNVSLDIGTAGKQSILFPFKMHNINDVINHYDDILTIIQTWPQNTIDDRVTGTKNKVTEDWIDCYYGIKATNLLPIQTNKL